MTEPWRLSAGELAAAYAARRLSPCEVLASVEERMQQVQPVVNAIAHWDAPGARAAARASEARWMKREPLSLLDGIPLTVKDNIPVAGLPCRWGSRLFADHVPDADEAPVARVREAGAVILGKTQVPEFTLLGTTTSPLGGTTRNPWNPALTPGGSSGGAVAAVASGIGPLALATDGGGSIRRPCAHTGLVGLKPSWGRVPRGPGLPEMLPGFEVIGPIARRMGDLLRLLSVIGPSERLPRPQRCRILCWRSIAGGPVDGETLDALAQAVELLRACGHEVIVVEAPNEIDTFNREAWPVISSTGLAAVLAPFAQRLGAQAVEAQFMPAMAAMWRQGRELRATDLFHAQACVRALRAAIDMVFGKAHLILTPAAAALPWPAEQTHPERIAGQAVGPRGHAVFTAFANACGLPALALPMGRSAEGLPIGLQLVGPQGADLALCALGLQWEAAQPFAEDWAPLAAAPRPATSHSGVPA